MCGRWGQPLGGRPTSALGAILCDNDRKKASMTVKTCDAYAISKLLCERWTPARSSEADAGGCV